MIDDPAGEGQADDEARAAPRDAVGRARDALERARPRVERLVKDATPRLEKAAKDALDYARTHDEELKGAAKALLWARSRGPWRLAFSAFEGARRPPTSTPCGSCGAAAAARQKFCTQCGARLGRDG